MMRPTRNHKPQPVSPWSETRAKAASREQKACVQNFPTRRVKVTAFEHKQGANSLNVSSNSDTYQLHDLGQVTDLLWHTGGQLIL